jgi:hypothetical protein
MFLCNDSCVNDSNFLILGRTQQKSYYLLYSPENVLKLVDKLKDDTGVSIILVENPCFVKKCPYSE